MSNRIYLLIVISFFVIFSGDVIYGGEWSYYIHDHLGNTRVVLDESGGVKSFYDYYPFGMTMRAVVTDEDSRYKYSGKELDDEGGLDWYYFGARYYDPMSGRWLSVDPLSHLAPDMTPYHYCHNNPLNRIDPDGRLDGGVISGVVVGGFVVIGVAFATDTYLYSTNPYYRAQKDAGNRGILKLADNIVDGIVSLFSSDDATENESSETEESVEGSEENENESESGGNKKGSRNNPDGSKKNSAEQLKQIEEAKKKADTGKLDKKIDKIDKSKQNFKNDAKRVKSLEDAEDLFGD